MLATSYPGLKPPEANCLLSFQLAYAKSHIEWAKKNKETWEEAKAEVDKIEET
jgi:hypothetical protein